ncbi:hypothetical protein [Legionella parisiensis]|uniref:Uncharacterized protein n=1 Tax=Legionella parisiensis TaxID=45071 RepID=A0A1E5JV70_9GAMM|nr:hypothetical protein [Legionella parisiensis]KTD40779.1 hypothetical protein Lpar_2096 [Legionella parisiensis]OEH47948.1 hypothetical protein lpari_01136 [Legionella parisiensis]STX76772.1 Uncharacterised protein [Legionella parisiensis]
MAKTLEELKKIINEQEAALIIKAQQQQLSLIEQQAFEKLRVRLSDEEGMDELPSVDMLQKIHMKPSSFEIQSVTKEALTKIFASFEEQFGKENIHGDCLQFPDHNKADTFFRQQANDSHAFLFKEVNSDNYAFSDGKGHYKMGCKADIISYCKKNSLELPDYFNTEPSDEQEHSPAVLN